jgi:hypothetical protein
MHLSGDHGKISLSENQRCRLFPTKNISPTNPLIRCALIDLMLFDSASASFIKDSAYELSGAGQRFVDEIDAVSKRVRDILLSDVVLKLAGFNDKLANAVKSSIDTVGEMKLHELCKRLYWIGSEQDKVAMAARQYLTGILQLGENSGTGKIGDAFEVISQPREYSKYFQAALFGQGPRKRARLV